MMLCCTDESEDILLLLVLARRCSAGWAYLLKYGSKDAIISGVDTNWASFLFDSKNIKKLHNTGFARLSCIPFEVTNPVFIAYSK
jgi:hypothetical protein